MKKITLLLFCFSWFIAGAQNDSPMVHKPALSPDGSTIAFSFQGDIWTMPASGGQAMRLTIHEGYESNPVFSPDGNHIAFTSARYGNNDIFTIPAKGGMSKRITWHSGSDEVTDWTADGKLLFIARRAFASVEREREILHVDAKGETPSRLLDAVGFTPVMSPDGRFIAMERGTCRIAREAYQGPANRNIWIYDTKNDTYQQLTTWDGQEFMPRWVDNRTLCFLSAESGRYNIHKQAISETGTAAGAAQPLTTYKEDGIRWMNISKNGQSIVFERQDKILTLSTSGGTPKEVNVQVATDYRFDPVEYKTMRNQVQTYRVSPNGKQMAFAVHGELFVKLNDKDKSRAVRLTENPYFDREVEWFNDSLLVFNSDRNGQFDLYLLRSSDPSESSIFKSLKHEIVQLTKTAADESNFVISPDGKQIAYREGRGKLLVATLENDKLSHSKTLLDGWATPSGVSWSPDNKWLAYSLDDLYFNEEIYIHPADNSKKPVNISMHPRTDRNPVWSKDGSKLGFLSNRNNGDDDVWFLWLKKEDWEKTRREWQEDEEVETDKKKKDKDTPTPIQIDFDDIHERLTQVTALPAYEAELNISDDGEYFYFVNNRTGRQPYDGNRDLHKIKWDGSELKALTTNGASPYGVSMDPDGKKLYYLTSGGRLNSISTSGKHEGLSFTAKMKIDHNAERNQVFEHAWRTLRDGFYDPNFNGQNWDGLKRKYKPWAMKAGTKADFRAIFNKMLGQLNASHMGLRGAGREETQRERTGILGLEVKPHKDGVEITRVVPETPADREESKLNVGEVISSVNGEELEAGDNFYSFLVNEANEPVILEVKNGNQSREVVIRPTTSINTALYEEWVDERKKLTEQYSNGKLGYIHIRGMNWTSFERFERELTASGLGKEGIVIDVRYNGGGWTTDYLMAVLNVKQHAYTVPRGAAKNPDQEQSNFKKYYPYGERLPLSGWTRPSVALCNANSYSNAEIFSHAYKHLQIGTLVGIPTFGAVISTGGQGLMDGSFVRLPFRGWYALGTGLDMELNPAMPDELLDNSPTYKADNEDAQLKKAVDVLLEQIGNGN